VKLEIIGNGAFGSFLRELLAPHFEISGDANSVILAVPLSAYNEVGVENKDKHLINVCSVQKPSTDILLTHTDNVTSIHPLFGRRTPSDKRNSIMTRSACVTDNDTWSVGHEAELEFLKGFSNVSVIHKNKFTPETHDLLMFKTHYKAMLAAKMIKPFLEGSQDISDELIPNSFRLLRDFVKTLDDMPRGTIESIMANPYA